MSSPFQSKKLWYTPLTAGKYANVSTTAMVGPSSR